MHEFKRKRYINQTLRLIFDIFNFFDTFIFFVTKIVSVSCWISRAFDCGDSRIDMNIAGVAEPTDTLSPLSVTTLKKSAQPGMNFGD